jgi:hypothetical protein
MSLGTVLPLVLLVLIVIVLSLLARRAAGALAVTRAAAAFQGEVTALAGRVTPVVDELVRRVDAVRRHQLPADEVRDTLGSAHAAFEQEREAVAAWRPPTELGGLVGDLAEDLDRFTRAVETIDFGTQLVVTGTNRQRELEAQTAIKRGYLNLLHARQSFEDHLELIARRAEAASSRTTSRA